LRIECGDLHGSLIADGGFTFHVQQIAAPIAGNIDVIERRTDKVQVAFQRQGADIAVTRGNMAPGEDFCLPEGAVAAKGTAALIDAALL
jgi:hypothetical protein